MMIQLLSRHLPEQVEHLKWGWILKSYGETEIVPFSNYPAPHHDESYQFSWERGRVLEEYQIIYISKGEGTVECGANQNLDLQAGQILILYPGVWHRYRPAPESGWNEHWVGFSGPHADFVMSQVFDPENTILSLLPEHRDSFLRIFQEFLNHCKDPSVSHGIICGKLMELLGTIHSHQEYPVGADHQDAMLSKGLSILQQRAFQNVDLVELAHELNVSYSHFRASFKKFTGLSPRHYQINIRLNMAKTLLVESELSIQQISEKLLFEQPSYFHRLFKKHTGKTPRDYQLLNKASSLLAKH